MVRVHGKAGDDQGADRVPEERWAVRGVDGVMRVRAWTGVAGHFLGFFLTSGRVLWLDGVLLRAKA
jgi:hypothetical protein